MLIRSAQSVLSPQPADARWLVLQRASQAAMILLGLLATAIVLVYAQSFAMPVALAIVVGLMLGPIAGRIEAMGIPPSISAALAVLIFLGIIFAAGAALAGPLTEWLHKLPQIWQRVQQEMARWQGTLHAWQSLQTEFQQLFQDEGKIVVSVADGSTVETAAWLAPNVVGQIVLFLASMYFFLATRDGIRTSILTLCFNRRLRWRVAHIFRDVEAAVSRYLLSITTINAGLGATVATVFWAAGVQSPLLWGILAALSNFVPFIGQGFMIVVLLAVGLSDGVSVGQVFLPLGLYLAISFVESQLITPNLLGRVLTVSPFLLFLAVTLGLFLWGPVGGFIAAPGVLISATVLRHMLSGTRPSETRVRAALAPSPSTAIPARFSGTL